MPAIKEEEFKQKIDWKAWNNLASFTKKHKKHFILIIITMSITGIIDAFFPLMAKYAIDNFALTKNMDGIFGFSLIYLVMIFTQAAMIWFFINKGGYVTATLSYDIRKASFEKLQRLDFSYYDKNQVGWIMSRVTSDVKKISDLVTWGLVDTVWAGILMLIIIVVMLVLNWKLSLIIISLTPLLVLVSFFFQKKILKSYRQVRKLNSLITASFNEGIMGAKTIKTLSIENQATTAFKKQTSDMQNASVRAAVLSSMYLPSIIMIGSLGTALAIWFGGLGVQDKAISYGTLVAFISYTFQFFAPVFTIARVFANIQNAQASLERVVSLLNTPIAIQDKADIIEKYGDLLSPKKEAWLDIKGDIEFKNVSFSYTQEEEVIQQLNLKVKAGEKIALVGETGAGKTTLVNLLCRFYEPTSGQVFIDGVDYKELSLGNIQSQLGYVLQTPLLFHGTIKENIQYGDLNASEEAIQEAAKKVHAHSFIEQLEQNYNTIIGAGGNNLSLGQKQLISFARAILAKPSIFILDEATSSVDTETEQKIQEAIQEVLKGKTSFIIAHRLSTIKSVDRILVMKAGKIIESGSHQELIEKKGHYFKLYTNQFIEQKVSDTALGKF